MIDDNHIRAGLAQGSKKVFEELFHALYSNLCKYAMRFLHDQQDAEEIVQNCFVKLWEKRLSAETIQSFKSYLFRSVYNSCMNVFEHEKIKRQYYSAAEFKLKEIYANQAEMSLTPNLTDRILEEIEKLPDKNQEVFKLRFLEGYNTKEVSEMLDITPRTVETHVSKSLKHLRETLKTSAMIIIAIFLCFQYVILTSQLP